MKNKSNKSAEEILKSKPSQKQGLDDYYGFQTVLNAMQDFANQSPSKGISEEKLRKLFDELINAGRDMERRDRLQQSYLSEDFYFIDIKRRYLQSLPIKESVQEDKKEFGITCFNCEHHKGNTNHEPCIDCDDNFSNFKKIILKHQTNEQTRIDR